MIALIKKHLEVYYFFKACLYGAYNILNYLEIFAKVHMAYSVTLEFCIIIGEKILIERHITLELKISLLIYFY